MRMAEAKQSTAALSFTYPCFVVAGVKDAHAGRLACASHTQCTDASPAASSVCTDCHVWVQEQNS